MTSVTDIRNITDLADVPDYSDGKFLKSTVSGTEWATVSGGTSEVQSFLDLVDTPDSYDVGKFLISTASGIEFSGVSISGTSITQTFLDLTDTPDTYEGYVGKYLTVTSYGIGFNAAPLSIISENLTLYITVSGSDITGDGLTVETAWETPHRALNFLGNYWISSTSVVTIQAGDGAFTLTTPMEIKHPCGNLIQLAGTNVYTKTMTSVQSSSGSATAYSIIINLDSVTDVAVNDYVIIHTASGGTNPQRILGCHKVTNVDTGNNRITITSNNFVGVPSGAVAATVVVFKTMFFGSDCVVLSIPASERFGDINKCVFVAGSGQKAVKIYGNLMLNSSKFGISSVGEDAIRIFSTGTLSITNSSGVGVFAFSGAINE